MREGAMRFIYGFILGVLVSVITAILYLAFLGGDYLLQLSPRYHDMASTIAALREAKQQRGRSAARGGTPPVCPARRRAGRSAGRPTSRTSWRRQTARGTC